jgi:hypothetical protein
MAMIAVSYFDGRFRAGLLVWQEPEGESPRALGGFDPGPTPAGADACTVVATDAGERVLVGWVHPDQLAEVSGADGPDVRPYYRPDGKPVGA